MTAYFDEFDLKTIRAGRVYDYDSMRELESRFVFDISVCVSFGDFPEDLRDKAHQIIIEHAVEARPVNSPDNPSVVTWDDHAMHPSHDGTRLDGQAGGI